jgi:hypothetical protein
VHFRFLAAPLDLGIKLVIRRLRERVGNRGHDPRDRQAFDAVQQLARGVKIGSVSAETVAQAKKGTV